MKRFIILFSILLLGLAQLISAQNLKISLPDTSLTVGANAVNIPLLVQNFNNVGAVSLKLTYNPKVLKFTGISSAPVSGFVANADSVNGTIAIAWFSPDGSTKINISNGTLLNLVFNFSNGTSQINFIQSQSDISDINSNSLTVSYINGIVNSPIKVSLDNVVATPGDTVRVPIRGFNLENIGAISLQVNYSSSVLQYIGIQKDSVGFTANNTSGQLKLGWTSLNNKAYNSTNGILAWIVFKYVDNTSNLSFFTSNGASEIADLSGNILSVNFVNGSISKLVSISLPNIKATPNTDVSFALSDSNISVGSASLKIAYDNSVLTYKSISTTGNKTVVGNASNGILTIGYYNAAATTSTGVIANIVFTYKTGSSSLVFDKTNSEVTDQNGAIYSGFTFNNGSISLDHAPVFTKVPKSGIIAYIDSTYKWQYLATDVDGDSLVYDLVKGPKGSTINTKTGLFTWAPTTKGAKDTITVSVSDGLITVDTTIYVTSQLTGIIVGPTIPKAYNLTQNYPNPFNPSTNINFDIPKESKVVLKVFNILGQEVATLVNQTLKASNYTYQFNASNLSSGIYIYRLQAGDYTLTKKMTLLK